METDVENTTICTELRLQDWNLEKCLAKSNVVLDPDHLFYYDIYFWASVCIVLTVGMGINCGILVYYEWYGGDAQKRSLVNRFISNGLICSYMGTVCRLLGIALMRSSICEVAIPKPGPISFTLVQG